MNNNIKLAEEINLDEFKKNIITARENKNLSIKEISQTLNISADIIQKLENGDFNKLPSDIFIAGHIRTYLNWIEINPKLIINDNTLKTNNNNNAQKIILPYTFKLSRIYIIFLSAIFLFLLLIIYKNLNKLHSENIITNSNITDNIEKITNDNISLEKIDEMDNQLLVKDDQIDIKGNENIESLKKEEIVKDVANNDQKIISTNNEIDFIYIEAIADSWIEIQNKNAKILVSKIIKKDEEISLPYEKDLILVTGNAGGIIIQINGNKINNIGSLGEVKRNISLNYENLIKFINEE